MLWCEALVSCLLIRAACQEGGVAAAAVLMDIDARAERVATLHRGWICFSS